MSQEARGIGPVYFALHHKCGNNYFGNVLRDFAEVSSNPKYEYAVLRRADFEGGWERKNLDNKLVRLRNFPKSMIQEAPDMSKVVVCIRDPRSLIVSCTDYHARGSESWTLEPKKEYGGLSYSEFISSGSTDEDRLIRSMKHVAGRLVRSIETLLELDGVHIAKLEDLSWDRTCKPHLALCDYLELSGLHREQMFNALKKHSLWRISAVDGKLPRHSTGGAVSESSQRINGRALQTYQSLFGDIHTRFGYA